MRSDMNKVFTDRPRRYKSDTTPSSCWNNGIGNRIVGHALEGDDLDVDLPKREGRLKRYGWEAVETSGHYTPLKRFLRKNCGRVWNDVYSDICLENDSRSKLGRYIRRRIVDMVELDIKIVDGKPITNHGYQVYQGFYVHPETGILHWVENARRKYRGPDQSHLYQIEGEHYCEKLGGIWYDVGVRRRVENPFWHYYSDRYSWVYQYKRQLSGKELKRYGLQND